MKKTLLLTAEKYQILPVKGRYFTQECINHEVQAQVYFAYLEKFLFQKAGYKYISTKWSFQVYKHKEKHRTSGLFLTWVTVLFITFCNQEFPELPFETHHGFMVHGLKKSLSLHIRKHWIFQVFYWIRKKVWYLKCMFMVI